MPDQSFKIPKKEQSVLMNQSIQNLSQQAIQSNKIISEKLIKVNQAFNSFKVQQEQLDQEIRDRELRMETEKALHELDRVEEEKLLYSHEEKKIQKTFFGEYNSIENIKKLYE